MVKNAIKKIRPAKVAKDVKETIMNQETQREPASVKKNENEANRNWKQDMVAENAYITSLLGIVNFPKREDSDDEDVTMDKSKQKMLRKNKDGAQSVQELRARLKAKLDSLQGNQAKDPEKNAKKKLTKEEKKAKMREEKRLQAKLVKMAQNSTAASTSNGAKAKPVYNSEGKMVFSKFDFTANNVNGAGPSKKNPKKDPKLALDAIQKQKHKLKKLEEKGDKETVKSIEESSAWTKALDKAEGVKVKDDVGLLKKSIKKKEQRKKSSAKKWDARKETETKQKQGKVNKREENIKKRKTDKKANKMKKLAKKGRIPGFR